MDATMDAKILLTYSVPFALFRTEHAAAQFGSKCGFFAFSVG
jgi:hypothetical protein